MSGFLNYHGGGVTIMGFMDILKGKKRMETRMPERRELEIPPAPPKKEELPTFPIPKKRVVSPVEKIEEEAVKSQQEELEEREELKLRKPIFVDLDLYKEMINEITLINSTLKEGKDSLARMDEFREDEDKEFSKWENSIKDIQKKLIYADKTLFAK